MLSSENENHMFGHDLKVKCMHVQKTGGERDLFLVPLLSRADVPNLNVHVPLRRPFAYFLVGRF